MPTVEATGRRRRAATRLWRARFAQRIALRPAGALFSPEVSLVWIMGLLGVGACIAPWFAHGWLWFGLIATAVALLACYDALALWLTRQECAPVLLPRKKDFADAKGRPSKFRSRSLAPAQRWLRSEIRVAIMPATQESETAIPGEKRASAAEA